MIPLRLKAETTATEPFVARLRSFEIFQDYPAISPADLVLERAAPNEGEFAGDMGRVRVEGIDPSALNGDVVFVVPSRGIAHRLIRADSRHNTLLVTEQCDQLCVMCSQPPKKHHVDLFAVFESAIMLAPQDAIIGISGGEPMLHKTALFGFLERTMRARPDIGFHILTNAQHFRSDDLDALNALDAARIIWGVPLYSADPVVHDEVVGKHGAYTTLAKTLSLLCRAGAIIELRTVLMQPNAAGLPDLAWHIHSFLPFIRTWAIMQLENIGFGRKNWNTLFYDSSNAFGPIGKAIDFARSRGIETALYNFPLCTIPAAYRSLAAATISDWKRAYRPICETCSLRYSCGGLFEWHPKQHGYAQFGAQ